MNFDFSLIGNNAFLPKIYQSFLEWITARWPGGDLWRSSCPPRRPSRGCSPRGRDRPARRRAGCCTAPRAEVPKPHCAAQEKLLPTAQSDLTAEFSNHSLQPAEAASSSCSKLGMPCYLMRWICKYFLHLLIYLTWDWNSLCVKLYSP